MRFPDARDELLRQAVIRTLTARPHEAATWLLRRGLGLKVEVVSAAAIAPRPERHLTLVSDEVAQEPPERSAESALKQVVLDGLVNAAGAEGYEASVIEVDWEEMRHETFREGGCDVQILALVRARDDEEPSPLLLAVPLASPDESGEEMPWEITGRMAWQMLAWENLVARGVAEDDYEARTPRFMFAPLYLWPGTGLKDVEEVASVVRTGALPGLLGLVFGRGTERDRAQRRRQNLRRLASRKRADRRRRAAAKRRLRLMGETFISEEELAGLFVDVDVDNEFCSLSMSYRAVRTWEQPFEKLLRELPPGCVALALAAYPGQMSRRAMLERCAWTLRRQFEPRSPDLAVAADLVRQVAACWLEHDEIDDALRPFGL